MQLVVSCDLNIVNLLKNKDKQALEVIFKKYGERLYSFIYQQLHSEELANIALKRTFSLVWDMAPAYNNTPEHFFIWLLRLAREASTQTKLRNKRVQVLIPN